MVHCWKYVVKRFNNIMIITGNMREKTLWREMAIVSSRKRNAASGIERKVQFRDGCATFLQIKDGVPSLLMFHWLIVGRHAVYCLDLKTVAESGRTRPIILTVLSTNWRARPVWCWSRVICALIKTLTCTNRASVAQKVCWPQYARSRSTSCVIVVGALVIFAQEDICASSLGRFWIDTEWKRARFGERVAWQMSLELLDTRIITGNVVWYGNDSRGNFFATVFNAIHQLYIYEYAFIHYSPLLKKRFFKKLMARWRATM